MKHKRRIAVIALLTVVLLALFLRKSDPGRVWELFRSIDPIWLLPGFLANFTALVFRTLRWRVILSHENPPRFYPTFFSTAIGFMSSALLPIRAGDVIRPALLSRRTKIRFSSALGTVATERTFDLTSIVTLFLIFVGITQFGPEPMPPAQMVFLRSAGLVAAAILLGLAMAVPIVIRYRAGARRLWVAASRFIPARFRESWANLFDSFLGSFRIAKNPWALIRVVTFTALIWMCLTSQFYFVMHAFGRPLPYRASFLVTALSILGFSIPTPGGVGGFDKACQIILRTFYGFDVDLSVAITIIFHLVGTLPVLLTGGLLFAHEGLTWKQIEDISEEADGTSEPPATSVDR